MHPGALAAGTLPQYNTIHRRTVSKCNVAAVGLVRVPRDVLPWRWLEPKNASCLTGCPEEDAIVASSPDEYIDQRSLIITF